MSLEGEIAAIAAWTRKNPIVTCNVLESRIRAAANMFSGSSRQHWIDIADDFDPCIYEAVKTLQSNINDKDIVCKAGEQLNEYGGHAAMTTAYRALSVAFHRAPQEPQRIDQAYKIVERWWNGIGTWLS